MTSENRTTVSFAFTALVLTDSDCHWVHLCDHTQGMEDLVSCYMWFTKPNLNTNRCSHWWWYCTVTQSLGVTKCTYLLYHESWSSAIDLQCSARGTQVLFAKLLRPAFETSFYRCASSFKADQLYITSSDGINIGTVSAKQS